MNRTTKYDWVQIQKEYDAGLSQTEIKEKYGMSTCTLFKAVRRKALICRSKSVAAKVWSNKFCSYKTRHNNGVEEKLCPDCKNYYPSDKFYWKNIYNNKQVAKCKICHEILRKKRRLILIEYVTPLLKRGCVDCGETEFAVLEFDHIIKTKTDIRVSGIISGGQHLPRLKRELAKCEVRCANCHTRRHRNEHPSLLLKLLTEFRL